MSAYIQTVWRIGKFMPRMVPIVLVIRVWFQFTRRLHDEQTYVTNSVNIMANQLLHKENPERQIQFLKDTIVVSFGKTVGNSLFTRIMKEARRKVDWVNAVYPKT